MNVFLLYARFNEELKFYPPLGVAYLASVLKKNDFKAYAKDGAFYKDFEEFKLDLVKTKPDVLGISICSAFLSNVEKYGKLAKQLYPHIQIVVGGPHVTVMPSIIEEDYIDFAVVGEGEETFLNLVKALNEKKDLSKIKGILYKKNKKVIVNEPAQHIENLDKIPYPDREIIGIKYYLKQRTLTPLPYPSITIMASRGCPGNCAFCQPTLRKLFGPRVRYRTPKNVVDEIEDLIKAYKIKGLLFVDDEPTFSEEWIKSFCQEIINRKIKIKWLCASRVDLVNEGLLQKMKEAGCIAISFGVESGSQEILNHYRKGFKVEQIKKAFYLCKKVGIIARANLMFGAIIENNKTINDSINLIREIKPDLIYTAATTPNVGTDLHEIAKNSKLLRKKSLNEYNRLDISSMKRIYLTDNDVKKAIQRAISTYKYTLLKSFFNPKDWWRRRYLYLALFNHWFTMLNNLHALFKDILFYINYAHKEKIKDKRPLK